jgi:hypothetical protein
MDILEAIRGAQGGGAVQQLGQQFGLNDNQVSAGFHNNMSSPQGLDGLLGALGGGQHQRYVDDTGALGHPDTVDDGNGILGHIFGSKDVSRQVAAQASAQSGIGADVLKGMLPVVAAMMMGTMSKKLSQPSSANSGGDALTGMLAPMLSSNSGSIMDGVAGLVGRLFAGR